MKNILIPIDGSVYSNKALELGREIAREFDSSITVLNAIHVAMPVIAMSHSAVAIDNAFEKAELEKAREHSYELLQAAKDSFGDMADKVEMICIEGDAVKSIVNYANANGIDLLIMGSHGLGAVLERLLVGSVTTKVLHQAEQPVLVVK